MRPIYISAVLSLLLSACSYKYPTYRGGFPTAMQTGAVSTTTSLAFNVHEDAFMVERFAGYKDSKVIAYKLPDDTVNSVFFQNEMQGRVPFGYHNHEILYPGFIWVSIDKLMDETEITNLNWAEFVHYVRKISGDSVCRQMLPDETRLPRPDYFTNPFFRLYPVVGITHEQAEAYCRWRTETVNMINKRRIADKGTTLPRPFVLEIRLPTEKEWETFAGCGNDLNTMPWGVKYVDAKMRVNPKAAQYLKIKNQLTESVEQIKQDIRRFNKGEQRLIMFNVDRPNATYFLANKTPFYIFDLPINNYGAYNMIGNVAELVKEKGITKGGSYLDKLEDCAILKKGNYTGASPGVGFRTVCELKY